jgi:hypothetical protein
MSVFRSQRSVAVLFSEHEEPEQYVVSKLARYWREDGIAVHYLRGTRAFVPADVLFLHVDLSVLPQDVNSFAQRYPVVINQHVRDIRKRTFSTLMVSRKGGYTGPVIVKSNFNFGGSPESGKHPSPAYRAYHRARRVYFRLLTGSWGYQIYASPKHVPAPIWCDPNLVVERFVPERVGSEYAVRTYHYFGERESFFLLTSPEPIVKSGPATRMHPLAPDPRLRAFRHKLKLDYGKIDYVLADGEPVVLDLNKTIGLTERFANDPEVESARRERAGAIYDFLR